MKIRQTETILSECDDSCECDECDDLEESYSQSMLKVARTNVDTRAHRAIEKDKRFTIENTDVGVEGRDLKIIVKLKTHNENKHVKKTDKTIKTIIKDIESLASGIKFDTMNSTVGNGTHTVFTIIFYKKSLQEDLDVFFDEELQEHYYIGLCEDTLQEKRFKIRITSKGQRIKKIKCPKGKVAKSVNGRTICTTQTGSQKLQKKLSIKKSLRTKKAKGAGFKKRTNFKRQKAMKKRKSMGLRNNVFT